MQHIELRGARGTDRISLRGVRIRARLAGMSQKTTVEQTFVNMELRAIEAVYTFPLPEGAAVCAFEVLTSDRVFTGAVEEADKAIEKYEQAIDAGDGAFLVEQERPDVFTARAGNLKPGQAATIRLTYVCPLEQVDRAIRLAFPTTLAPRYASGAGTDPREAPIQHDAINPPHVLRVPYGLSLEVEIDLGRPLRGITSPSHQISIEERAENKRCITLAGGMTEMDRDVIVAVELEKEHEPIVQVTRGSDGAAYLAVTFVPEFEVDELVEPAPAETFFVLDCSGSMQGPSIAQATAALELCLRSLSEGDTFNICRFGSRWELMSSEPLVYTQATLDRAITYVRRGADLGGTELLPPLEAIFSTAPRTGKVRQVILLTDGQVTNEPAIVDLARRHRSQNRIFSFGIGAASSAFLVKGIARATGGASEFITAGERIDEKVLRTFGRIASPMATDISMDWANADVQTLAELPPVFDGDVFSVFGRCAGTLPKTIALSCITPTGPKKWAVGVPDRATYDGGAIATMWARRMIQSLEEVNGIQHFRARQAPASREREMLVRISKEFGLVCTLTTFIAIEHRSEQERNEGRPALRRVPVKLAHGWHDIPGLVAQCAPSTGSACLCSSMDFPTAGELLEELGLKEASPAPKAPARSKITLAARGVGKGFLDLASSLSARPPAANSPHGDGTSDAELWPLLNLQSATGAFASDPLIDQCLGNGPSDRSEWHEIVRKAVADVGVKPPEVTLAITTVAALLLMRTRFADRESLWRRPARKAIRYLAKVLCRSIDETETWLGKLQAMLPGIPHCE